MNDLISVVVPAYNAERFIGGCLESLLAMDYPDDKLEIIVVDNHSSDRTAEIIGSFPVVSLSEARRGTTNARNTGINRAGGNILAFTDADCVVAPDWASEIEQSFRVPEVDAVMGFTGGIDANFWARLEQSNYKDFWFLDRGGKLEHRRAGIDTRNSAIRRRVLAELGNFRGDLPFCGDLELSVRLRAAGCQVILNENMCVDHHNRTDLAHILRIKHDHGRAYLQIVAEQPEGLGSPHLPSDMRRYFWIDNERVRGAQLLTSLFAIKVFSTLLNGVLRVMSWFMGRPNRLAHKLFKTLCGNAWEIELLESRRREGL